MIIGTVTATMCCQRKNQLSDNLELEDLSKSSRICTPEFHAKDANIKNRIIEFHQGSHERKRLNMNLVAFETAHHGSHAAAICCIKVHMNFLIFTNYVDI